MNFKNPIRIAITLITIFFSWMTPAHAQNPNTQGVAINPSIIEETIVENQKLEKTITVKNLSSSPKTLTISITNSLSQDNIKPIADTNLKLSEIIKLNETTLDLNPSEQKNISFSISNQAPPGGYIGSINLTSKTDSNNQTSGTGINVKAILLINIGSGQNISKLTNFTKSNQGKSIVFTTTIENKTNFLQKTKGKILIYTLFGNLIKTIQINPNSLNIPPLSQRDFSQTWDNPNNIGIYTAEVELFNNNQSEKQPQKIKFSLINKYGFLAIPPILIGFTFIAYKKKKKTITTI